ncbi:thiamine diphosphokinase [Paroceanicella profunda]|uniref:thiamine diphosphokinase n=1 Tax=Paroceanicella profunda TaxID=2579971 RepID=UPI001EF0AD76|nr:thiamine diphosphokinase [Paroceanicella profunda]
MSAQPSPPAPPLPPFADQDARVTLVGGGDLAEPVLRAAEELAPRLFAADGGADRLRAFGRMPEAIIGDLDSLGAQEAYRSAGVEIRAVAEQDSTDFEKCLTHVAARLVIGVGFTGGRVDHLLSALSAIAARPERRILLLGPEDLCFLAAGPVMLDLPPQTRVSLWPVAPTRVTRCEGLVWNAEGMEMAPDGRIGTSNAALGGPVTLAFDRPGMLVFLPLSALGQTACMLNSANW